MMSQGVEVLERPQIDVSENDVLERCPRVLEVLLKDRTTEKNIFWATRNYEHLGKDYSYQAEIKPELITGENADIIMPRVKKDKDLQKKRAKGMAEIFTPAWVCNSQNNMVDSAWFGRENVFNTEKPDEVGKPIWEVNTEKVRFPKGKTWKDYVRANRLEITCGEAPYITSRYDVATGEVIALERRIGLLDRKLRIVNENTESVSQWLKYARDAVKSTYGYEWQGDNLVIARKSLLYTFIENYAYKFGEQPRLNTVKSIAEIISWNIWQMDGLKFVIPDSCKPEQGPNKLFGEVELKPCPGCKKNLMDKHTGQYAYIMDWAEVDPQTGKKGLKVRFIDAFFSGE